MQLRLVADATPKPDCAPGGRGDSHAAVSPEPERETSSRIPRDDVVAPGGCDAEDAKAAESRAETAGKRVIVKRKRRIRRPASPVAVLARAADCSRTTKIAKTAIGLMEAMREPVQSPPAAGPKLVCPNGKLADDFWTLWLEHRDYLRRHSLRFSGGNFADAEDALSEAMIKAAQTFRSDAIQNHRAWLLRLVHNACMDRHRSNRRQSRLEHEVGQSSATAAPAVAMPPERSPEELLAIAQQMNDLKLAMSALPPFLSEPLLRYLDDQSDAEIASSLCITKEVVRKRRQIARALLRNRISI